MNKIKASKGETPEPTFSHNQHNNMKQENTVKKTTRTGEAPIGTMGTRPYTYTETIITLPDGTEHRKAECKIASTTKTRYGKLRSKRGPHAMQVAIDQAIKEEEQLRGCKTHPAVADNL